MGSFFIQGEISDETVKNLIEFTNNNTLEFVYIKSSGGCEISSVLLCEILNEIKPHVKLIEAQSAAFDLFFSLKGCKRTILPLAMGMTHYATMEIHILSTRKAAYSTGRFFMSKMADVHKSRGDDILKSIGFNRWDDLDKSQQGDDVYFTTTELQEFLDYQENDKNRSGKRSRCHKPSS